MCKHFDHFVAVLYHVLSGLIPRLQELAYIPFTCLGEDDYLFCMRLNFHRFEHRHESWIEKVTVHANELAEKLSPEHIVHKIQHKVEHKIHHIQDKVDSWVENFGGDLDLDNASMASFGMITAGQFLVTILMAALFVTDIKLGYMNFDNIVGLMQ